MGLFDFARDAGQALRNMAGGQAAGQPAGAAAQPHVEANDLAEALRSHGVTLDNGRITVSGETATVTGQASNQQEKELAVLILGNTRGIAHVDDQITLPAPAAGAAPAAQGTFYTVQPGDSLSKIAKEKLGDASRYGEIFEANKPMLKDPDEIYPGQTLRIPSTTRH